jgi:hypothetical protein
VDLRLPALRHIPRVSPEHPLQLLAGQTAPEPSPRLLLGSRDERLTKALVQAGARSWDGLTKLTGKGDDVVRVDPATSGLTTATITYRGPDNFIVHSYGTNGRDGLANEIGNWSGQVQLTDGTFLLEVLSSGTWSISEP